MKNLHVFHQRFSRGFTLLELLVVAAIIGLLATAAILFLDPVGQFQKANDGKRKADLASMQRALEQYYQDFNHYPASQNNEIVDFTSNQPLGWGSPWNPYLTMLPIDPSLSRNYVYYARSDDQAYWLYASLEKAHDPSLCNAGAACPSISSNGLSATACGTICNFVVKSPNVAP